MGSVTDVRERIDAYAAAGAQQIHLWPAADPLDQLEALADAAGVGMVPAGARPAPNP